MVTCARAIHTKGSVAYCFEEKAKRTFLKEKALSLGIPEGRLFSKLQRGQEIEVLGKKFTPEDVLSEPSPGRKFVYTGDTKPSGRLADFFRNADALIHDCTYSKDEEDLVEGSAHSTTVQAAEAAKSADVKALYLTHLSQRYQDPKRLEEEAREVFKNSFVAEDFLRVKVAKHKTQY
ncbi:MAG: hypothetical protein MSIBF_02170 [Candidatus Altiarchaeales archaeon IMC4]|nr:MAG: hypothetical protein MSIBF_02170 [Candidatus Altiarchaeales archaeon IMC4]